MLTVSTLPLTYTMVSADPLRKQSGPYSSSAFKTKFDQSKIAMVPGKAYHFTYNGDNPRCVEGPLIIVQLCEELAS